MAAGFTVDAGKLDALGEFLNAHAASSVAARPALRPLLIDAALAVEGATPELLLALEKLEPFGVGNHEPRLVLTGARLGYVDPTGNDHLRCVVPLERGGRLTAMAFRAGGTDLGSALIAARGGLVHLAGHLRADRWNGRDQVQFIIEDAAPARLAR
jgi:single-stranded-DNA-specific exonuclease